MKKRFTYHVCYLLDGIYSEEKEIDVIASSKFEAYDLATYEKIPAKEGRIPYGSYVSSVTYANGNYKRFNNHIGDPY